MSQTIRRRSFPACAVLSLAALGALLPCGCLPSRVVIDLSPRDKDLDETTVLSDGPRGDASLPKVALIDVNGLLTHSASPGLFASRRNPVDTLVTQLAKAEADAQTRAVVLRINSPGGTVAASETLFREIEGFRTRSGKPVVASFAEVAASGGYYISLATDRIVAQPSSITGSIGVIIQTFNFSKGMSMIGVEGRAVVSRSNKDLANPFEPPVESQFEILQGLVDQFYAQFRGLVVERRAGIAAGDLDVATDGRVFTGAAAHELGLVDAVGDLRDSFAHAKELAGLQRARMVKYHARGDAVSSPYATTGGVVPENHRDGAGLGAEINLVRIDGAESWLTPPGAYYLWRP